MREGLLAYCVDSESSAFFSLSLGMVSVLASVFILFGFMTVIRGGDLYRVGDLHEGLVGEIDFIRLIFLTILCSLAASEYALKRISLVSGI